MILWTVVPLLLIYSVESSTVAVPKPVAFFPLNGKFTTNDEQRRPQLKASASNAILTTGPNNEPQGAYQFCGNSNSYIEFPNSHGILDVKQSMTLMCWVRPGGKDGPLFNYNKAGAWGVHIWIANGRFFNRIPKYDSHAFLNHIQTDQPLAGLAGGKWIHVAATYDHNTGVNSIYLDGVLSKTQNIGTGFRISTNDRAVRMGAKIGDGRYFKGAITQMRSYDVALTAQQILVVRNQAVPQPVTFFPLKLELVGGILIRRIPYALKNIRFSTVKEASAEEREYLYSC